MTNRFISPVLTFMACGVLAACAPADPEPQAAAPAQPATVAQPSGPKVHIVCPAPSADASCTFNGGAGIQAAIDAAADGDVVQIRAGTYTPAAVRDVPYRIHTIRGFIVIDGKRLSLIGEPGVVLDGSTGVAATAIIVHRSNVDIQNLTISGFRWDVEEDEIYEGHGIFAIDSRARIADVTISKYQKMGLVGRGDTVLDVTDLRILDGHVAIWLHESAYLRLSNAVIRGNDSSGVAAYDSSVAHVSHSVFDRNLDDALYGEHEATIYATNTLFLNNKPYVARATGNSRIWLGYSALFGNEHIAIAKDKAIVRRGPNLIEADPKLDADYRQQPGSPLAGKGDPDFGSPAGTNSQIGLR